MKPKNTTPNKPGKKFIKWIWIAIAGPVAFVFLILLLTSIGVFGALPTIEELANPRSNLASEIYSSENELIGKFFIENRSNCTYDELSPKLVDALIATEDARFYQHSGVDAWAISRVVVRNLIGGDADAGGGSTLTQQLAKNLFPREKLNKAEIIIRKLKEWIIAMKLERNFTKEEIIALYLNQVDFGNLSFGIKSAAKVYFRTSPDSLTTEQAALLVGMLKGPSLYNPRKNYDRALIRRNVVLGQMLKYNKLSEEEFNILKEKPIDLSKFKAENHKAGQAPYFKNFLKMQLTKWCKENKKPDGTNYNIYKDGLKIYTTLNMRMQSYAEKAAKEHLKVMQDRFYGKRGKSARFSGISEEKINQILRDAMKRSDRYRNMKEAGASDAEIEKAFQTKVEMDIFSWDGDSTVVMSPLDSIRYHKFFLQTGLMAIEPQTGYVRAWVGGIDHDFFQYDHVYTGKRQVGSTFKPFVYAVAMQEGWSPCARVPSGAVCVPLPGGGQWCPRGSSGGMLPLKTALAKSVNTVSAYIIKEFGVQPVINLARLLGITSNLVPLPSICLGASDISVFEMAGAMSTFVNKGIHLDPTYITRIEDRNGNVIANFVPKSNEALDEQTAYLVIELMKGVIETGTATRLRGGPYGLTMPIAGKTGTTQNNSDGWFMGLTPNLVTAVWVGCEDRSVHLPGYGADMALPIWGLFMKKVYADKKLNISREDFEKPAVLTVETDCSQYYEPGDNTGEGPPPAEDFDE
ncbi:MAG: penicillin-binding protein 1A [Bacteroidia bacterium]